MSEAMKLCTLAMASSMGIGMQNAITNQRNGQTIATVDTNVICGLIIATGSAAAKPSK